MAGMLPGVEAARRRRVHQSSGPTIGVTPSFRRSSLSLYSSNSSSPCLMQEKMRINQVGDENLGQMAREAKERLDERLRAQSKPPIRRNSSEENINGSAVVLNVREIRTEVYGLNNKKKKALKGWANKLGWRAGEQEECAVCLEEFKVGEKLVNLPCAHRFHSLCLVPWVHTNAHCPCCRKPIFS